MLVKKLKVLGPMGHAPGSVGEIEEVKYLLTVDLAEMAEHVGLPLSVVQRLIQRSSECGQFYGTARDGLYFTNLAEKASTRTMSLKDMDLRITENIRYDASYSFAIIPVVVTNPKLVGDLTDHNGNSYHLIPNVRATLTTSDGMISARYVFKDAIYLNELHGEVTPKAPFTDIEHDLLGFDLLLLPKSDAHPDIVREMLGDYQHNPTPTEEEASNVTSAISQQSPWVEIALANGEDKLGELALRKFAHRDVERYRYELSSLKYCPEFFFALEADADKDATIYSIRNTAEDYFQRIGDSRAVQLLHSLSGHRVR